MKIKPILQGTLWFLAVIGFLAVNFTISFFLSGWIFQRIGQTPSPLALQIINSIGGILIAMVVVGILTRIFKSKFEAGEMSVFGPIIEALARIAKGDFSVQIDSSVADHKQARGVLDTLVKSVNQMALELNEMETMRQEFISNVSHEIQSPLTSIRGFAQALHSDHLSADERRHYLTIIETESTRLSKLAENLLKLASLEANQVKFEPKSYRLDRQIRNLILACEPQWTSKAIEMDVSLQEVEITADEDLLSQVWINLISNSIKFTPETGRIWIELCRESSEVRFKIADTGIGISPADQPHIFERFYKADKSRTHSNNGGSGLGLAIVHRIVEMHNGSIAVASQLDHGTTFTVTLPVM